MQVIISAYSIICDVKVIMKKAKMGKMCNIFNLRQSLPDIQ